MTKRHNPSSDNTGLFVLLGIGAGAFLLYKNGTLASWFPSLFAAATAAAPPASSPPAATAPGPPVASPPASASAPPAAAAGTPGASCTIPGGCYSSMVNGSPVQTCSDSELLGQFDANGVCQPLNLASGTNSPAAGPPANSAAVLTVQDAATFPYSSAVTAAQMNAINAALQTEIQAAQVPVIAGDSVLAFMLGWGGQPSGAMETVLGENYSYDGSNWHLVEGGVSGLGSLRASRVPLGSIHGGIGYRFRVA
jgi:hypothetical protein